MSSVTLHGLDLPLRDDNGVLRVGATRVTLDTVVGCFNVGASAEDIQMRFPSLSLSDIYAVVSYYLTHRAEIDAYLAQRKSKADEWESVARENPSVQGIRERLLARRKPGD